MKIVKCQKCGREFTQHFPESSYWKKILCPSCRVGEEEESNRIDEDWERTRRSALDRLASNESVIEEPSFSPGPPDPEPAFTGGGGSFGGGGASVSWEPSSEPSTSSEPEPSYEPSESPSSSESSESSSSSDSSSSDSGSSGD